MEYKVSSILRSQTYYTFYNILMDSVIKYEVFINKNQHNIGHQE